MTRGGALELLFADGVNLATQIGRLFDLFDWAGASPIGEFAVSSPYDWDLTKLYTTGEVTLTALSSLPGDFNGDGSVDAADYVVWRKTGGTPAGYDSWRANFGRSRDLGSGSTIPSVEPQSVSVPEPCGFMLAAYGALGLAIWISQKRRGQDEAGYGFILWSLRSKCACLPSKRAEAFWKWLIT